MVYVRAESESFESGSEMEIQINHSIPNRRSDRKRTCQRVDFALPVNHRVKIKGNKTG